MSETPGFEDRCLISCGMLQPEIAHLMNSGFLNPRRVFFTPPGLHALPDRLEKHLLRKLAQARRWCSENKLIVVYGKKCYVNTEHPSRRVHSILKAAGRGIVAVQADYGYDMLAGVQERNRISGGREDKILWFTIGWLRNWHTVYRRYFSWDAADANANFPGFYDKVIVLDSLGVEDEYMTRHAEAILEIFDWTGLEVEFHRITLDRFKGLLLDTLTAVPEMGAAESQEARRTHYQAVSPTPPGRDGEGRQIPALVKETQQVPGVKGSTADQGAEIMPERQLVWIDDERCIGCGTCLEVCPTAAIALVGDKAHVNEELCTGCEACVDVCAQGAIQPVVEGEAVPLPQHPVPAVQVQRAPLATERAPIVAIGAELLTVAVEALARAVSQYLAQPSSKGGAAIDESQPASDSTRGGGGHRARRRRRGSG